MNCIGGAIEHVQALTAIGSSTVNSFRRLWDTGLWAPVYASWGDQNRTCALESKQLFVQSTTGGNSSPSGSSTGGSFSAPTEHSNSSSEVSSDILQSQDVNPPAEVPSGSLRYLDYGTAEQPSRY